MREWTMKNRYGMEIRTANGAEAPGVSELLATAGIAIAPLVLADRLDAIRRDGGAALIAVEWGPPSGLVLSRDADERGAHDRDADKDAWKHNGHQRAISRPPPATA